MRRAMIFAMAILLVSCKTTKETSANINQGQSTTMTEINSHDILQHIESMMYSSTSEHSEWGSITTITFYDTEKPVDPDTGRPPIAAEYSRTDSSIVINNTTETNITNETKSETKNDSIEYQQRDTASVSVREKTKTTPLTSTASFKIIITLLLTIGALIAYIKYRDNG